MHERTLALAARPEPVILLGLLLRPYSIGHELCLIRANNPFALPESGTRPTAVDLAEAVWICHQTWAENRDDYRDPLFFLKRWIWRTRIKLHRRTLNIDRDIKAFEEYRESGSLEFPLSDMPKPDEPASRPLGAPFLLLLEQFTLRTHGGFESWDYPLGLAKCEWQAHWELEGCLRIWNSEDQAHEMARQKWEALRPGKNQSHAN